MFIGNVILFLEISNGKILKLEHGKIPQVVLHNIDRANYIKSLAEAERQISAYKGIARLGISNRMKQIFNIDGDCFQIFDKRAGGILFKDWEWELIENGNPLKQLFETRTDASYSYCLETDEGRMLRGSGTYYYFLTNKGKSQKVDNNMVHEWTKNYGLFIENSIEALMHIKTLDCQTRRMLIGILDNIRNVALIMLNANIVENSANQNIIIELSKQQYNKNISKWANLCELITKYMKILCFSENIDDCVEEIQQTLNQVNNNLFDDVKRMTNESSINLDKSFRSYREIDNYIENYIAIYYAIEKIKEKNPSVLARQINFMGATYGGLELPFIANEILENEILLSTIVLQSKYKDRKAEDYLSQVAKVQGQHNFDKTFNILGDDNVLTGKTLQSMINLLFSTNIAVDNIAIVRYPSLNRVPQMIIEDSAIDVSKFFEYIQGLVFTSPYTKMGSNSNDQYLDALGIFNKDRRRLLEYLYKNGRYDENSEVAEIGRMYEKGS